LGEPQPCQDLSWQGSTIYLRILNFFTSSEFVAAYREASEKFRAGNRTVTFPLGSFPPALPFVAG